MKFPRGHRLTRGSEIKNVSREGKRIRTSHLEVRFIASFLHHPRVAIVVPKYGHSAVERNKVKRRLRELVRLKMLHVVPQLDIVLWARPSAYGVAMDTLERQVDDLTQRLSRS